MDCAVCSQLHATSRRLPRVGVGAEIRLGVAMRGEARTFEGGGGGEDIIATAPIFIA